ncbi:MAG: ParB N-terminal domain-containing protein [Desmonostoc geniculatum HA4340-LM1]|jgi:hypothetical protein|nr:ParB N-terminal domain-containing protein [Desmonostoc geniculatum HA4340-LM1]
MSQLEISLILTDGGTQSRASLNQELIDEYAEAMTTGANFLPVTVFYDGTNYWLADGFHRLEATKKIGSSTIAVEIRQGTRRDAVLYSVGANATHGLRRSNADKRRAVLTLFNDLEWSQWSNNEIAKQCGVAEWLVRKLKEELSSFSTKIDQTYARKCGVDENTLKEVQQKLKDQPLECTSQRNGTTYSINTSNIGRYSKKVSPAEESSKTKAFETKAGHLLLLSSSPALSPESQPRPQIVDVSNEKSENSPTEEINKFVEQHLEVTTQLQSELNNPSRGSLSECVRIINIKQEIPQQVGEAVQTFEVIFLGVCVEIQGRPDILVTLFQQMQDNLTFTEEVLGRAHLLSKNSRMNSLPKNTKIYNEFVEYGAYI